MKNQNNLLNMMQTGGLTSTSGGAALARALQRQGDIKKLERQARKEARTTYKKTIGLSFSGSNASASNR